MFLLENVYKIIIYKIERDKMKKFIPPMLMLLVLFFGCSTDTNINSPETPAGNKNVNLIKLPAPEHGLSINSFYTTSKYINGYNGGNFWSQFNYQSISTNVVITSQLFFPSGSFPGGKTITQTFNTETASLEFGPSMQFNIPVLYTLTVSGLDLTGINPATLDFVYVAQDGSITGVQYDSITMDTASGTLKVTNARLEHFSRYGFVN